MWKAGVVDIPRELNTVVRRGAVRCRKVARKPYETEGYTPFSDG